MKIGIIGGGTMGLSIAYRMAKAGHEVTVLEAAPQLGGLATWFDYGKFTWDKYYHVICRSDTVLLSLFEELGIADRMRWVETKTGFLWKGRHISMSNNWEFLTFPALPMIDKIRLAYGILQCRREKDPARLEKIKATQWLQDTFGKNAYEAIWEPLLDSKYSAVKEVLPATIMWATINRYSSTRTKEGKEMMGCLDRGFKVLYESFEKHIPALGGTIRCGAPVASIEKEPARGVTVTTAAGDKMAFDMLVSTLPTNLLKRIAPQFEELYQHLTAPPRFLGVICMSLVLRRALSPYYVTNLIQKGFPFTGIIGLSNLTGPELLNGWHLAMLPRYDIPESSWFTRPQEDIAEEFLQALEPVWPDIRSNLESHFVHRERFIQPLWIDSPPPELHEPARTGDERIWVVNAELAGRDTFNNNATVRVVNRAMDYLMNAAPIRK